MTSLLGGLGWQDGQLLNMAFPTHSSIWSTNGGQTGGDLTVAKWYLNTGILNSELRQNHGHPLSMLTWILCLLQHQCVYGNKLGWTHWQLNKQQLSAGCFVEPISHVNWCIKCIKLNPLAVPAIIFETIPHILLHCQLYDSIRQECIPRFIQMNDQIMNISDNETLLVISILDPLSSKLPDSITANWSSVKSVYEVARQFCYRVHSKREIIYMEVDNKT